MVMCTRGGRRGFAAGTAVLLMAATVSCAQERPPEPKDFDALEIEAKFHKAPDYGVNAAELGNQGEWASKPWLILNATFQTKPEWLNDVQVKFYVLMGRGKERSMFTGEVTLANVKKGRHAVGMFMHPSAIDRYGRGEIQVVAVRLFHRGRPLVYASDKENLGRWWDDFSPIPGYLLPPSATPWVAVAHERYDPIKSE